jgi:hypothetical protein
VKTLVTLIYLILFCSTLIAQQISIDRIEMMPDTFQLYQMRNWKQVAIGYDSLVFNLSASGDYLPLIWIDAGGVNYPNHNRFGIDSYVGAHDANQGEAINVLPAVIGATLVGIDKTDQSGVNWVEMCEEFFNKRPEENVYLNNFIASSGQDWWYDTMPNIFFYQLYSFYPDEGDFHYQFNTIADRWLAAIKKMGASQTPWNKPYMNYRAFKLANMTPLNTGVKEPEAAGALAWILYMAYIKTSEEKYRIGSEWAMEFLSQWNTNPSYELQLPYGVYIAARMNAELGTDYNVEKLLNWCFTTEDNVRSWGMTLGNWGGYDADGLIGEAQSSGYAFTMNGFEQAGALVPMVRYDDRFARTIGKWILHLANASRLLYSNYLPGYNQDNESWAQVYDQNSYISYEALREEQPFSGTSPYATGDAMDGGWAETNLALYGASHVGILGSIIDTTNVEKILKLDLLKTNYFGDSAYPSFLFYNPYYKDTSFVLDLPAGEYDIYDAIQNTFIKDNVSNEVEINIDADAAILAVLTPSTGIQQYVLNKLLIDSVVVDYNAGLTVSNFPPRLKSLASKKQTVLKNETIFIYAAAEDFDLDPVNYEWYCSNGSILGDSASVEWTAPANAGSSVIKCTVSDGKGGLDSSEIILEVLDNQLPRITGISCSPQELDFGEVCSITCQAEDADGDSLIYTWSSNMGSISGQGKSVEWTAPEESGYNYITCLVEDVKGGSVKDSIGISVGHLVAAYSFIGSAFDSSGYNNHGQVIGANSTEDRFGNPNAAYHFNGVNAYIKIPNTPALNFENAITVLFWIRIDSMYEEREAYPISHGNWENRWKVSITNEGIRWTVKSASGIKDLDSQMQLLTDIYYHIGCVYDGSHYEIYINGILDNASTFSGKILKTSIDLTIGQVLPNNTGYNFNGIIDDILIFNRGLSAEEIEDIYDRTSDIDIQDNIQIPKYTILERNYPNPFNSTTQIHYRLSKSEQVKLEVYNYLGQKIKTLVNQKQPAGIYYITFNATDLASGLYFCRLRAGSYVKTNKMIILN